MPREFRKPRDLNYCRSSCDEREWMIRAFAIGLAVVTKRLILIPALLVVADPTEGPVAMLSAVSFMAAFAVHSSLAEVWIRLTRRSGVPGTHEAKAA